MNPARLTVNCVVAGACALVFGCLVLPAARAADGASSSSVYEQARRFAAEGRAKQAIEVLDQAAASGVRTPELYELRAQLRLSLGDQEAAERDWRRAAQLDPTNVRSRLALAKLHARRGLWADAITYYREVLLAEPRNVDAVLGLAEAYEKMGRTVGAQALLQAASGTIDDRRIHERWARVALQAGRPEEAEHALRRIAALSEGAARRDALVSLAELYRSLGRPQDALAAAREALEIEKPTGPVTDATYDAIALATDYEVRQTGETLPTTLAALGDRSLSREEAFAALESTRSRLVEAGRLLEEITPPDSRRSAHARRLYAYALVDEAALNALAGVDLGLAGKREACASRLAEAQAEIARLAPPSKPSP